MDLTSKNEGMTETKTYETKQKKKKNNENNAKKKERNEDQKKIKKCY